MSFKNQSEAAENIERFKQLKAEMHRIGHTQGKFLTELKKHGVQVSITMLGKYGRGSRMPDKFLEAAKKIGYDTDYIMSVSPTISNAVFLKMQETIKNQEIMLSEYQKLLAEYQLKWGKK